VSEQLTNTMHQLERLQKWVKANWKVSNAWIDGNQLQTVGGVLNTIVGDVKDHTRAAQPEAAMGGVDNGVIYALSFLLDRLNEFSSDNLTVEGCREWNGHILPAFSRGRTAIEAFLATPAPQAQDDTLADKADV